MRYLSLIFLSVLFPAISLSADVFEKKVFTEVRIDSVGKEDIRRLIRSGVNITGVRGNSVRADISSEQFEELRDMGYDPKLIPDMVRLKPELRSGYHTHSQLTAELKAVESAYPDICRLHNIGESYEGRPLWFMQISDNVGIEEDEPEFKYISTMHGNEPLGMELCLKLIHLLAENYGSDERVTNLVAETEIWIMPLMNPDGYVNNERRNAQGFDLNRTFPDQFIDSDNSPDGRPTEVQHIMNWAFNHSYVLSANFHTGALLVNYPYDSNSKNANTYTASPDDDLFVQLSQTYASNNPDMRGNSDAVTNGAAWYTINGGMQDWNYVWMGCNEVTIELSNTFWPAFSEIAHLWDDNREAMLAYMEWSLRGVRGIITDKTTGQPLNAAVEVICIDHKVYTDPDVGDYHRILVPGTYNLQFSAQGYYSEIISDISVSQGNAARLDVSLIPQIHGDINADRKITLSDLISALQIAAGGEIFPVSQAADVNGDKRIGIEDAVYILNEIRKSYEL